MTKLQAKTKKKWFITDTERKKISLHINIRFIMLTGMIIGKRL
jgi:hypothetical protein